MKKYAVIKIAGSQCKVSEADEIEVNKIEGKKDSLLTFEEVLLLVDDKKIRIGQPLVKGVKVKARIIDQFKGKKIKVATYKAKSRFRKVKGSRSLLTKIRIEKIVSA